MAFPKPEPRVPTQVGTIVIYLKDPDGTPANRSATYELRLLNAEGIVVDKLVGNLTPHLTAGQISALQAFMDDMRAKAVAEALPT